MKQTTMLIQDKVGLHARPAAEFVNTAKQFQCAITVSNDGKTINGKSLIQLLSLGVTQGTKIVISADGADEEDAIKAFEAYIQKNEAK